MMLNKVVKAVTVSTGVGIVGLSLLAYNPQKEVILSKVDAITNKSLEYKSDVKTLKYDNAVLNSELNRINDLATDSLAKIEDLKAIIANKDAYLVDLEAKLEEAISQNIVNIKEIESLKATVENLKSEIVVLNSELNRINDIATKYMEENEKLTIEVTNLKSENADLKAKLDEALSKIMGLNKEIVVLNSELNRINDIATKAMEENEELVAQIDDLKNDKKSIIEKANSMIAQANEDQDDIVDALDKALELINE